MADENGSEPDGGAMRDYQGACLCGAVRWRFRGAFPDATICNCTACRRYGVLWIYGDDGHEIHVEDPDGKLTRYSREKGSRDSAALSFNFCSCCGNVVSWRALKARADGRVRTAVNIRLAEPETVAELPLQRFDGLQSFDDLPKDGRCVADVWF